MTPRRGGLSLVGLLVTMVCIVVLFVILMNTLNTSITGGGAVKEFTARSTEDKFALSGIFQSIATSMIETDADYLVPSRLTRGKDRADDTTAALFSTLVAKRYVTTKQLVSANEFSGYVEVDHDYDYTAYQPARDVYWDEAFRADLADLSNVSFAHMPLYGERFDRRWKGTLDGSFPLLGNRGPKDGVPDPTSWTYGRDGTWGGHVVFGDGHVEFLDTFTPGHVTYERDGRRYPDNLYAVEDGPDGRDAILSFTRTMDPRSGPELQFD
ncbi:MAG: hypothetical protein ACYTG1_06965 [Planctomycetota bacterium]|jgi:hypothetical protein